MDIKLIGFFREGLTLEKTRKDIAILFWLAHATVLNELILLICATDFHEEQKNVAKSASHAR